MMSESGLPHIRYPFIKALGVHLVPVSRIVNATAHVNVDGKGMVHQVGSASHWLAIRLGQ